MKKEDNTITIVIKALCMGFVFYVFAVAVHEIGHYIVIKNDGYEIKELVILGWDFQEESVGWVEYKNNSSIKPNRFHECWDLENECINIFLNKLYPWNDAEQYRAEKLCPSTCVQCCNKTVCDLDCARIMIKYGVDINPGK